MKILAIDPGTDASGLVLMDGRRVLWSDTSTNYGILAELRAQLDPPKFPADGALPVGFNLWGALVACEMVAHYGSGMAVGREVFETVEWIGRFREAWESRGGMFVRVYRRDVKLYLCGSAKAKDGNVRQAIIDLYGGKDAAIGKKRSPGPLYGVSGHEWSAVGIALTAMAEQEKLP